MAPRTTLRMAYGCPIRAIRPQVQSSFVYTSPRHSNPTQTWEGPGIACKLRQHLFPFFPYRRWKQHTCLTSTLNSWPQKGQQPGVKEQEDALGPLAAAGNREQTSEVETTRFTSISGSAIYNLCDTSQTLNLSGFGPSGLVT